MIEILNHILELVILIRMSLRDCAYAMLEPSGIMEAGIS